MATSTIEKSDETRWGEQSLMDEGAFTLPSFWPHEMSSILACPRDALHMKFLVVILAVAMGPSEVCL